MVPRVPAARSAIPMLLALVPLGACSLLLETSAVQCTRDADCARFPAASCDLGTHLCVPRSSAVQPPTGSGGSGAGGAGGGAAPLCREADGCHACLTASAGFLNACTDGTCLPFDNRRVTRLGSDGSLAPLPP